MTSATTTRSMQLATDLIAPVAGTSHLWMPTDMQVDVPAWVRKLDPRIVYVTPELAAEWLNRNTRNRKWSKSVVDRYSDEMAGGPDKWTFSTDGLGFYQPDETTTEPLENGQQRLLAVIQSGRPQWFLVIFGMPEDAVGAQDIGRRRTRQDAFAMAGLGVSKSHAAAFHWIAVLDRVWKGQMVSFGDHHNAPSLKEGYNIGLDLFEEVLPSVRYGMRAQSQIARIPAGLAIALHVMFRRAEGEERANEFFDLLHVPAGLLADSPVFRLNQMLGAQRQANRSSKWTYAKIAAMTVRAFNYWLQDVSTEQLTWDDRPNAEKFPQIGDRPSRQLQRASEQRRAARKSDARQHG